MPVKGLFSISSTLIVGETEQLLAIGKMNNLPCPLHPRGVAFTVRFRFDGGESNPKRTASALDSQR